MKNFLSGGIYRLLFMAFNFGVGLIIAALAGTGLFGVISLMVVNTAIFNIITGLGTESSIMWHGASKRFDTKKLFTYAFLSSLIQLCLFILISIIFFKLAGKTLLSSRHLFTDFYFELLYFFGIAVTDKYVALFYAEQRAKFCNQVLSVAALASLLFILIVYSGNFTMLIDPLKLFCIITFFQCALLILAYHYKNSIVLYSSFFSDDIRSFVHFSFIVFITNLVQFLAYRADYWFIDYFRDASQVGIYAQGNKFAQLLWIIPNILAALLEPLIASPAKEVGGKEFSLVAKIMNILNLLIAGAVIVLALFFYNYFLPDQFSKGFRSLLFMIPGFYFFTITIVLAAYFSGKRLLWINFFGSMICLFLIIIADILLIPSFGINGAAIANSVAYSVATIFNIVMFLRITGRKMGDLFKFKKGDLVKVKKLFT